MELNKARAMLTAAPQIKDKFNLNFSLRMGNSIKLSFLCLGALCVLRMKWTMKQRERAGGWIEFSCGGLRAAAAARQQANKEDQLARQLVSSLPFSFIEEKKWIQWRREMEVSPSGEWAPQTIFHSRQTNQQWNQGRMSWWNEWLLAGLNGRVCGLWAQRAISAATTNSLIHSHSSIPLVALVWAIPAPAKREPAGVVFELNEIVFSLINLLNCCLSLSMAGKPITHNKRIVWKERQQLNQRLMAGAMKRRKHDKINIVDGFVSWRANYYKK